MAARKTIVVSGVVVGLVLFAGVGMLFVYPRPTDTTDPVIFALDGATVDYCVVTELDGSGKTANDIPMAYTPGCGWERWPGPVLSACTEPLVPGSRDLRGLWRSTTPGVDHVERIEQCGNRVVVTTAGIIHDFRTDGTLENGSRDIEPPYCMNTWAAIEWRDDVLSFRPFGLPFVAVTRKLEDETLLWKYPGRDEISMKRICRVP